MVSGLQPALSGASLSGFMSPRQIPDKTLSGESRGLITVVLDALSVFNRVFRPPIDPADTSGA